MTSHNRHDIWNHRQSNCLIQQLTLTKWKNESSASLAQGVRKALWRYSLFLFTAFGLLSIPWNKWASASNVFRETITLRVAHVPGSPPPRVSDPDMHHGTCVTHAPWCMPGSLTSGFVWSRCRGKRSRHSRRMHNPQFYVSGKRTIKTSLFVWTWMSNYVPNLSEGSNYSSIS